jgi:hypothetical protein
MSATVATARLKIVKRANHTGWSRPYSSSKCTDRVAVEGDWEKWAARLASSRNRGEQ